MTSESTHSQMYNIHYCTYYMSTSHRKSRILIALNMITSLVVFFNSPFPKKGFKPVTFSMLPSNQKNKVLQYFP